MTYGGVVAQGWGGGAATKPAAPGRCLPSRPSPSTTSLGRPASVALALSRMTDAVDAALRSQDHSR